MRNVLNRSTATDEATRSLLRVTSSPRPGSVTNELTQAYAAAWSAARPGAQIVHHDLPSLDLPHLGAPEMGAWFTDDGDHTDLHRLVLARSSSLIDDLLAADELVIGAPMWNFSIPSNLKAWIDHVTKDGRTFQLGPHGPTGLVPARRAVVVSARGSDYRPGTRAESLDLQEPYLRLILGFLGITEVIVVNVDRQGPGYADAATHVEQARRRLLDAATQPAAIAPAARPQLAAVR
ncbi:MAG: NAD(P)H-dependent oxidoreductase [Nocardioides sp.]